MFSSAVRSALARVCVVAASVPAAAVACTATAGAPYRPMTELVGVVRLVTPEIVPPSI
jgi:hypothetical protein